VEDNRSRRERRALATRAIEPAQLGLAGAAQLGCRHRQSGQDAEPEVEYFVTSRVAGKLSPEEFLNTDRQYWGVESGLPQRLDGSGFEDRLRVRHKGAVHIPGLFARVGVALFVRFAWGLRSAGLSVRTVSTCIYLLVGIATRLRARQRSCHLSIGRFER
jgi:hypothetical protein